MNRFRLLAAVAALSLGALATADKIPTWLVGKYTGYSSYMKASFDLTISQDGLVFGRTQIGDKKSYAANGRYHHEELIIGHKIYGVNRRDFGNQIVNEGNRQDTVDLKKG